jgi:hypothetical protein
VDKGQKGEQHSAEAAALGFYYQSFYALLALLEQNTDNAAIAVEQLDDVALKVDGQTLLYQLKHSLGTAPPPLTLKSRSLWRTIKAWIDILPRLTLSETSFHLVTVSSIANDSPLQALLDTSADRASLTGAMVAEAQHVTVVREAAKKANAALPYSDRADGCVAFLALGETERQNLIRRMKLRQDSPDITCMEPLVADHLKILPAEQRTIVAQRLIEWWDRQIVYSLCHKRDRLITRTELQLQISNTVSDLIRGKLLAEFETLSPPNDYQPNGMLSRQIRVVEGKQSDHSKAIREEWKAREQRSKWLNGNPAMAATIYEYDGVLKEHWADRHSQMA